MPDMMNELRKIYSDFFGKDAAVPDDKQLVRSLVGDDSEKMLKELDEALIRGKALNNSMYPGTKGSGDKKKEGENNEAEASGAKAEEKAEEKPERPAIEELNELIGLDTVKQDVKELIALAKVKKIREQKGMRSVPVSLHLVFSGNPGTGKTTVARILARLYKEIGILSKGQLVEVDRSALVAGYVGQTAIKTQEKIKEAMGGILFIDEAYSLSQDNDAFGQESIDTILKAMEDHRDDLIVIVAGYTEPMKKFIGSNPGLKSRFNKYMEFKDYTAEELLKIFDLQCNKYQYTVTEEAAAKVRELIEAMEAGKGRNFANARNVRNLFESIITNQAARISEVDDPADDILTQITAEDMEDIVLPADEKDEDPVSTLAESLEKLAESTKQEAQ